MGLPRPRRVEARGASGDVPRSFVVSPFGACLRTGGGHRTLQVPGSGQLWTEGPNPHGHNVNRVTNK